MLANNVNLTMFDAGVGNRLGDLEAARQAASAAKHSGSADPGVAVETFWLKCIQMPSEGFVQVAQSVQNRSDPGP